jgi:hypothetical protein
MPIPADHLRAILLGALRVVQQIGATNLAPEIQNIMLDPKGAILPTSDMIDEICQTLNQSDEQPPVEAVVETIAESPAVDQIIITYDAKTQSWNKWRTFAPLPPDRDLLDSYDVLVTRVWETMALSMKELVPLPPMPEIDSLSGDEVKALLKRAVFKASAPTTPGGPGGQVSLHQCNPGDLVIELRKAIKK